MKSYLNKKRIITLVLTFLFIALSFVITFPHSVKAEIAEGVAQEMLFSSDYENDCHYRILSLVKSKKQTLFAFCNDRLDTIEDNASYSAICLRRKEVNKDWEETKYLLHASDWGFRMGTGIYDEENDKIMLFVWIFNQGSDYVNKCPQVEITGSLNIGWHILESSDDGFTWKFRDVVIFPGNYEPFPVSITHGNDTGIQIKKGEHKGRLVVPAYYKDKNIVPKVDNEDYFTVSLYSDDGGISWKTSNKFLQGTCESSILELEDGTLYCNSRYWGGDGKRRYALSNDGGKTWEEKGQVEGLTEPAGGISSSTVHVYDQSATYGNENLYFFVGLNNYVGTTNWQRKNLSIWCSIDDTKTWNKAISIDSDFCAYSSAQFIEEEQKFYVIYESGNAQDPYVNGIAVASFSLEWATANVKTSDKGCNSQINVSNLLLINMLTFGVVLSLSIKRFSTKRG